MRRLLIFFIFFLTISATGGLASAQDSSPVPPAGELSAYEGRPRVKAMRLEPNETISVDGRLDEPIWQRALPATGFMQQDPANGEPATERTEVRFAFSGNNLYMGVICFDSEPTKWMGNTMLRDAALASGDRFQWTFDPFMDGRSGYFFEMNPVGSMGDAVFGGGEALNNNGRAWDGIWYANVNRSEIGWTIEIEIPFRTLNFDPNAPAWGLNFQRTIRRKNEESLWTGWVRNQGLRRMSNAGLLEGISNVTQGIGLNVQPYVTGTYNDFSGRNLGSNYKGDVGVDFVYSITPQLKGNFTINTDFAETEVDQRRVNLTRFPLFFPERRGFFLEGTTFFDFSREPGNAFIPFFSRRVGLSASSQPQRIDYGAKITGQVGANDIGVLRVRTAGSTNDIGEDFTVMRGKHRFFRESYAGMIYTRRAERGTGKPARQTGGADLALATSRLGGSQNLEFNGYYLWNTRTGAEARRALYGVRIDYPNDFWDARLSMREVQPGFDPAVGYIERRNIRYYGPALGITPRPRNSRIVRSFSFEAKMDLFSDLQNRALTREVGLKVFHVQLQSLDNVQVHVTPTYERLERNFEISRGVILPGGRVYNFTRYSVRLQTNNRRVLQINTTIEKGKFYSGTRRDFTMDLGIRPRTGVLINMNSEWNRIELPEGRFSTSVQRLTSNVQFSPWISVANNVQFDSVSRLLGWQSRFRWIVRPGNDIYFVYAHNWLEDSTGRRLTLDRSAATKIVYTHRF